MPRKPKRMRAPRLGRLIAEVREATAKRGKKSELARFLKVPPQRINDWLTDGNWQSPNAEALLGLQEWIKVETANQKRPGGATNTARAKTRKDKSSYEKIPQSRRKK